LFVKARDEVQNIFVKSSIKTWAISCFEGQCKIETMNSIEQKTGSGQLQTARSEKNQRYVTADMQSRRQKDLVEVPREIKNTNSDIAQLRLLREALVDTNKSSLMYFAIVSKCFWGASII